MKKTTIMAGIILGATTGLVGCNGQAKLDYPETKKVDTVDVYFGTQVADPYRWLEDDNSTETAEWVKAQNAVTNDYLETIPFRGELKEKLTALSNYEKMGTPWKEDGKYYFFKNDGLQNQSVIYECDSLGGEARVLLDPNKLSEDGTVSLGSFSFSKDRKYLAYVISRSGSDWNEIYVMDAATGELLEDHIEWAKFTGVSWQGDGFYYSAYDAPADGKGLSAKNEFQKVYYHKIGTPQSQDRLEYMNKQHPLRFYQLGVTEDERFLVLYESDGEGNAIYVKDTKAPNAKYVCIADDMSKDNGIVYSDDKRILMKTNEDAPNYKVVAFDVKNLGVGKGKVLIPETENLLESVNMAGDKMIATYMENIANHAYLLDGNGNKIREIKLPTVGSVGFSSSHKHNEVFYSFSSYTFPGTIYSYDLEKDESAMIFTPKVDFNPEDYVTEQISYPSKDSTMVNMFITYKKGLERNGKNPVFLYGYGGFNISLNPGFSAMRIPFIANGGIYVVANLRGGGEFGEEWHKAGTKMQKQNVFDDFIAAAEYLVKEGYTSPEHIAINGGSNGGLLVGAVVNQRPDLFRVAVPQVGVMDMLRYHTFTIGWNWASDYGRSDDSQEMFEYLYGYSPLHTIKNGGTKYPAIMVTTADHDDRVVPAHSFKYAAQLQASNTGDAPKIIRIESNAGHGGGKPIAKVIDEQTDIWSFIMHNLGMKFKK